MQDDDVSPTLQLQPLVNRVYDKARFELTIDYDQTLSPTLSNSELKKKISTVL